MSPPPETSPSVTRLLAPAKLTLGLRVTGVREDGFHLIDAEMVTLDLADDLEVQPLPPGGTTVLEVHDAATGRIDAVPAGADNLVCRALELAGRVARVRLTKHIPPGAGLGGGSASVRWSTRGPSSSAP